MKILLIGGCLNKQKGIPREKHYHTLLSTSLNERFGERPTIEFAFYSTYTDLHNIIANASGCDYVVLFVRPYPIIPLTKPFVKYTRKDLTTAVALHPTFSKKKYYLFMADERSVNSNNQQPKSGYSQSAKWLNKQLGIMLGLPNWAVNKVAKTIQQLEKLVSQGNARFLVVGPPPYLADSLINQICFQLNKVLEGSLVTASYINIASQENAGEQLIDNDGIHLTIDGHSLIANKIFETLVRQ